jgi:nucleotidyltransferase/DNA polymerase involved in DNA repair
MSCGDDFAKVQQRLLGHAEMYQISLQPIKLPRKAYLMNRVKRKLGASTRNGGKILPLHMPIIVRLYQDGVSMKAIDVL